MKSIIFSKALLTNGWADNVLLNINNQGRIEEIIKDYKGSGHVVAGYALPGMNNVHSHAFQRAMAGLAEYSTSENDSFWTWRDIMYRFAEKITSSDLQTIAAQLYLEMLKAGYVSVTEFHYLHNGIEGRDAMSEAIFSASKKVNIGLCHLPVLYMNSGFGGLPLNENQRRFGYDVDDYLVFLEKLSQQIEGNNQHLGMAFHSLRAVPADALKNCLQNNPLSGPVHIHIAEQSQEVDDCVKWSGKRPVEWLYDHVDVDEHWCLIHATHLNENEVSLIAGSGAVVGLCPTTEANLGDGLFPLNDFLQQDGKIAIGSDSHISVSVIEELRLLEYGQRLHHQRRNIAVSDQDIHTGTNLYLRNLEGGSKASGFDNGSLEAGKRADIIVLDETSPTLIGTPDRNLIDRFIFSGNVNPIKNVWVAGEMVINDYKHANECEITQNFSKTMTRLQKILD